MHDLGALTGGVACEVVQLIAMGQDERGTSVLGTEELGAALCIYKV